MKMNSIRQGVPLQVFGKEVGTIQDIQISEPEVAAGNEIGTHSHPILQELQIR